MSSPWKSLKSTALPAMPWTSKASAPLPDETSHCSRPAAALATSPHPDFTTSPSINPQFRDLMIPYYFQTPMRSPSALFKLFKMAKNNNNGFDNVACTTPSPSVYVACTTPSPSVYGFDNVACTTPSPSVYVACTTPSPSVYGFDNVACTTPSPSVYVCHTLSRARARARARCVLSARGCPYTSVPRLSLLSLPHFLFQLTVKL